MHERSHEACSSEPFFSNAQSNRKKMGQSRHCAVLAYHKIGTPSPGAWETWFYVPERVFGEHLRCIDRSGWTPIDGRAFVDGLAHPERLPQRSLLITFDDGYSSVLRVAAPLLARAGFPAVMFVPVLYVGSTNVFDEGIEPTEPLCSWDELRELESSGVSIESHGYSHARLSIMNASDWDPEFCAPKRMLEEQLGKRVTLFSYPYGDRGTDAGATSLRLKDCGYHAAFLYGGGIAPIPGSNPFLLPRIPIGPDTDLRQILKPVE